MDDLDRLHRRLVQNIRAARPEYLNIPFTVQELYEQLVPYRHNRRELAIESNQDYETAIARLLSGERDYVTSDPNLREAMKRELASPTGEHGLFKEYAHSQIALAAEPGGDVVTGSGGTVGTMASATTPTATPTAPTVPEQLSFTATSPVQDEPRWSLSTLVVEPPEQPPERESRQWQPESADEGLEDARHDHASAPSQYQSDSQQALSSLSQISVPTGCSFCGGTLPDGREVNYCPHCGENLRTRRCPACGGEMDTKWRFCVTCGRRAT